MIILGIDPGPVTSGVVILVGGKIEATAAAMQNEVLAAMVAVGQMTGGDGYARWALDLVACETMQAAYDTIGASTIQTMMWAGEFRHARRPYPWMELTRQKVKHLVCGRTNVGDPEVRKALIDRFGRVGTKAMPGPTYGVTSHAWSALAVAVAAMMGKS